MKITDLKDGKEELRYSDEGIADKSDECSIVRESAIKYGVSDMKHQGEYTMEDYYNWPEDEKIELIDGYIYYMTMPNIKHQSIVSEIDFALKSYIKRKNGKCRVFGAGIDVRLDCDDKTIVVPDITLVCEKDKFTKQYLDGAPDLAIEVSSPGSRKKDMTLKLQKYVNAGVREYWIVDPEKETIIVYEMKLEEGQEKGEGIVVQFYSFDSQVPVGIFDGECIVDFKAIKDYI